MADSSIGRQIRRVVESPNPLREMSTRELVREQESLERLCDQAEDTNLQKCLDANERYMDSVAAARLAGRNPDRIEQPDPSECEAVTQEMLDRLGLRLQLCRTELSRRRLRDRIGSGAKIGLGVS